MIPYKKILYIFFVNFFMFSRVFASEYPVGVDHAEESKKHKQYAKEFMQKNLMQDGLFHPYKITAFIEHLKKERDVIKQDIYQGRVIEKVELDISKVKKAREKAQKKIKSSNILISYDEYLIPLMEKLLHTVVNEKNEHKARACVDDFIRGYIPFYVPNAHRNLWPRDLDLKHNLKRLFKSYKFYENYTKKPEANNLMIDEKNIKEIKKCLGSHFHVGEYLKEEDVLKLKKCGFDISKLNPGVSALWHEVDPSNPPSHTVDPSLFPKEDDKIFFDKVILRGHASPKIKIFYFKDGHKKELKLKMGQEVHTDIAISKIMEFAGTNQDQMLYKKKVKVYLGETSYEEFRSLFVNKYGVEKLIRFVTAYGGEAGDQWIELEDVLFETRENDELRVSSIDISSWDLSNRREYRSLLLLWGWLGLNNIKLANFKFLFKKTKNGLFPMHRMHDAGNALGAPTSLKKLKYFLTIMQYQRVNDFPESFLKFDHRRKTLHIDWNDFSQFERYFTQTSWWDLKWMARKISNIRKEDIKKALEISGMPEPVVDIYVIKLLKRRNDIKKAFYLTDEYPLDEVPDLKKYNPKEENLSPYIKDGKVVTRSFPGKNDLIHTPEKWLTFLPRLLVFDVPVGKWQDKRTKNTVTSSLRGLTGLKASLGVEDPEKTPVAVTTLPVGVGVQAVLSRVVIPNPQLLNANGSMRIYRIEDKITFRFDLDSPLLKKAMEKIKILSAYAGIKFYEYEFKFIHFDDNLKNAYLSQFNLPKIIADPLKFAAYGLKPLELIQSFHRIGLEVEGGVGVYSFKPFFSNEVSLASGVKKIMTRYFLRDEFGQLHAYFDKVKDIYGAFHFGLAEINGFISSLPLFRFNIGKHSFDHSLIDYVIPRDIHNRELGAHALTDENQQEKEYTLLKNLKKDTLEKYLHSGELKKNYELSAQGKQKARGIGAGFIYNRDKNVAKSSAKVILPSGEEKSFFRYAQSKAFAKGIDSTSVPLFDVLVSKRKKNVIVVEMEKNKKDNFSIIVRTQDYYKTRTKDKLTHLMNDLNRRFSEDPSKPFYKDFILPEKKELDKYYKVYGLTRVYIDGKKLMKKITVLSEKDLTHELNKHFWDEQFRFQARNPQKPSTWQSFNISHKVRSASKAFRKIKAYLSSSSNDNEKSLEDLSLLYAKFISKLKVEDYGIHFLRNILGEKGVFVMGELAGVLSSFSALQDLQQLQRRRFAGKNWGYIKISPPIQKFLRYHRLIPPSVYYSKNISDDHIFGELETALPPNIVYLFGHGTKF